MLIEENIDLHHDDDSSSESDNEDPDEEISRPEIRYYPSQKVLGKLYRAIDEHKIFEEIQRQSRSPNKTFPAREGCINLVWKYVQEATALIQYSHYMTFARDVKEA